MSLQNLLVPDTKNEKWAHVYCDTLECNKSSVDVIDSPLKYVYGISSGFIQRTSAAPLLAVPIYPAFTPLIGAAWTSAALASNLYEGLVHELRIKEAGRYEVRAYLNASTSAVSSGVYLKLAINGVSSPNFNISSSVVTNIAAPIALQVSQYVTVNANDTVEFLMSNAIGVINLTAHEWKIEIIKLT